MIRRKSLPIIMGCTTKAKCLVEEPRSSVSAGEEIVKAVYRFF